MARIGYDVVLLESKLSNGETMTLEEISIQVFGVKTPRGRTIKTPVSDQRARRAALSMVGLGWAEAIPNRKNISAVRATYKTEGNQLQALMNLACRGGVMSREEDPSETQGLESYPYTIHNENKE